MKRQAIYGFLSSAVILTGLFGCSNMGIGIFKVKSDWFSIGQSKATCAALPKLTFGVNSHPITNLAVFGDYETQMRELAKRNLRTLRVDINLATDTDSYAVARTQSLLAVAKKYCIQVQPVLATPFTWGDATDNGLYPAGDAAALYAQGYNRTYAFVKLFMHEIRDWEMGNEINLSYAHLGQSPNFGEGQSAAEFNLPKFIQWRSVLKGMSDALSDLNSQYGLQLRHVLNTTTTHFGFIDFMKAGGVAVDVVAYHYYENAGTSPFNYWGTFNLFERLAQFQVPIKINEINCAEIYNSAFENTPGNALFDRCALNLKTQLDYFVHQTQANIEEIDLYELFDEPSKAAPENRFGLAYDSSAPKPIFSLVTRFAGGQLSASEQATLGALGL